MTNGEPPPPIVTDLQPESAALCPGESVKFVATTKPPSATVKWTVAVDGGEPQRVDGDGNILEISQHGAQTKVVTASLENSLSATVVWKLAGLRIDLTPEPDNRRYVITDEPRMPAITATAVGIGGAASELEWKIRADFGARGCPPFGPDDLRTDFSFSQKGGNEITTTDVFGSAVRGGFFSLSFSAQGTVSGCPAFGGRSELDLMGTNPQQSAIQAALPHDTLRRIACKESGQRQFDALPNGGTGGCPLFGPGGKVGIMQIANPTGDEVWNWRINVAKGIKIFNAKVEAARGYPSKVRGSDEFKGLVSRFNQTRQGRGLSPIEVMLPDFTEGDLDDDVQQLEMDAIRGYNGWNGQDGFGLELHEFRVAVDLIDGEEVLTVANVNEETLQGDAVWERVPIADRPADIGSPNYVEEVLSFSFNCATSTVPCNLTGISPTTVTLFNGEPREFTANGTGLANVEWSAPEGVPDTGTGAIFTTKWMKTGKKTLTATCGGTTKTATVTVLRISIEINKTPLRNDDIVQVKCDHPPQRFKVHSQIKLIGPATAPVTVVLTNPDGRLRFPEVADTTITLVLPADGTFVPFDITGESASAAKGDAKIQARLNTATGPVVIERNVTVFSFDEAKIKLLQGGNFVLAGDNYVVAGGGPAVTFLAEARLRPAGVDCSAPQIAHSFIGIVQETSNMEVSNNYGSPTVVGEPGVHGVIVVVPETVKVTFTFDPFDAQPINDSLGSGPLYATVGDALKRPLGCTGGAAATSSDSPSYHIAPFSQPVRSGGEIVGEATWTLVNTTRVEDFRTFCVVYNTDTPQTFCALRQATWRLNTDSSATNQHANVSPTDTPADANPAMPPPTANHSNDMTVTFGRMIPKVIP
jgi:hypothetical protein